MPPLTYISFHSLRTHADPSITPAAVFLKRTYGSKKIDRVLGGRAIDTKTELVRRKVGKKGKVCTNFELNVGFFETHELKLETLGNTLRRCAENPNDVFPGWVKDRKWHDVLRLYVARRSKVTEKAETPAMIGGAASTAADEEDDKTIVQNPMMEVGEEDEEDDVDSAQAVEAEQPEEAAAVVAVAASDRLHIQAAAAAADCYMSKPVDIATGIVECFRAIERRDFGATSAALERVLSLNNSTGIQSDVRLIASMVMDMHPRACDSEEVHQLLAQEDVPAMSTVKELDMAHELAMHLRDAWPGFDSDFP